jgi:hypothetical protein
MAAETELESYVELAERRLWEADRTLDREVARSLRALAERYRRMFRRSLRRVADGASVQRDEPHYFR